VENIYINNNNYGNYTEKEQIFNVCQNNKQGVLFQIIKDIFRKISEKKDKKFQVRISYLEIYNEKIRDLLKPKSDAS